MVAAAGGDELAFAALFRRCWPLAWSVARAAASTPHAAEEAAVDGFAAAFGGIANLRQPASFPAYLAACVRNEARQAARRQPRPALLAGVTPAPPAGSSPEAALEHGEDALRARAALRALDRRQRDAITMVDVEGRPLAEVAAGLDISPNALHQLLHRARASLRQRFVAPPLDVDAPPACRACNDKLARYVSGRAGRRVGATVEEHTARCAACRARLEEARELRSAMRKAYGLAPLLWAAVIGRALRRSHHALRAASTTATACLRALRRGPLATAGGPAVATTVVTAVAVATSLTCAVLGIGGSTGWPAHGGAGREQALARFAPRVLSPARFDRSRGPGSPVPAASPASGVAGDPARTGSSPPLPAAPVAVPAAPPGVPPAQGATSAQVPAAAPTPAGPADPAASGGGTTRAGAGPAPAALGGPPSAPSDSGAPGAPDPPPHPIQSGGPTAPPVTEGGARGSASGAGERGAGDRGAGGPVAGSSVGGGPAVRERAACGGTLRLAALGGLGARALGRLRHATHPRNLVGAWDVTGPPGGRRRPGRASELPVPGQQA